MGLFDSLYFPCPRCGERINEQTKNGPCLLEDFNIEDELPEWLMLDLDNTVGTCYKCNAPYKIDFGVRITVSRKVVRSLSSIEEFEWYKHKMKREDY